MGKDCYLGVGGKKQRLKCWKQQCQDGKVGAEQLEEEEEQEVYLIDMLEEGMRGTYKKIAD